MHAIKDYYRNKSRMDQKAAWIGKAFAGLRSRQMNFGGGEMLSVIELLKEELRENSSETLSEIVDWMSHFEAQQRGMYARIDDFTRLLEGDLEFIACGPDELGAIIYKTIAGLPESLRGEASRIRVASWKAFRILLDQTSAETVFRELLINALKFSPADTPIDLHCYLSGDRLILEIVNSCLRSSRIFDALGSDTNESLGEPFMGGYDFPRFQLPGHDLCIGLSFSSALVHKMRGELRFMDVHDYSRDVPAKRYAAVLTFPLLDPVENGFQLQRLSTISQAPKS